MVDTSLTGMRCRTTKEIRSHQGLVRRYSEGIIQYNMDNLGRHLISVQWDDGVIDYVYPLEIELLGQRDDLLSTLLIRLKGDEEDRLRR